MLLRFWLSNKKRVAWALLFYFIISGGVYMAFYDFESSHIFKAICLSIALSPILTSLGALRSLSDYSIIEKFAKGMGDNSIISLFDNGHKLDRHNNFFKFNTECITGSISGLPVRVTYFYPERTAFDYNGNLLRRSLVFSFLVVIINPSNVMSKEIMFPLSLANELEKDIKTDVLQYAAHLKAEGYVSA